MGWLVEARAFTTSANSRALRAHSMRRLRHIPLLWRRYVVAFPRVDDRVGIAGAGGWGKLYPNVAECARLRRGSRILDEIPGSDAGHDALEHFAHFSRA